MDTNKFLECERNQFQKILNFQLPNHFKKIGIVFSIVALLMVFLLRITETSLDVVKMILRFVLLISLLIISISKDNDEDELVKVLRSQSYMIAFITGIFICCYSACC